MSNSDGFHPDLTSGEPARRSLRSRVHHVRASALSTGTAQTEGMQRFAAISGTLVGSQEIWMGETHVSPATASDNHHHFAGQGVAGIAAYTGLMRTDNDTWDITTSVGATALFVAASRALEANKAEPLVVDPYAEIFCRAVGGVWADVLDGKAPDNKLMSEFGRHFVNYQAARTKFFDDYFYAAADAGVRQIVIPAAGLDSRAYRLAWPKGTVVFELDQPQVLKFKTDVLTRSGDAPTAERREIAVDLREDWPHALRQSGFDPSRASAWLVEGLLVYLPAAAQGELFTGIHDLAAHGSHVAVDDGKPFSRELYEAAREQERASGDGAQFFSLIYNEQHAPAIDWFTHHGWQGTAVELPDYFQQIARPVPGPDSEAGPMFAGISLVSAIKE